MASVDKQFARKPGNFNLLAQIEDDEIYYDADVLPIVPLSFDDIIITECLHATGNSTVYSGYMVDEDGARYEPDIAFKFGNADRVRREFGKYRGMADLQGTAIPRLIGLAYAKTNRGEEIGCLMTELFGSSLDCSFYLLTRSEKATILNHLQALHGKGLLHGDFRESNVLQRGAEFRLVDFDRMRESHMCHAADASCNFHGMSEHYTVEASYMVCGYIRVHAQDMDFWDDGTVSVNGFTWKKEGLPTARILHDLFPRIYHDRYTSRDLPGLLWHYYRHTQTLLENGTSDVEHLKAHIDETAASVETQWRAT